MEYSSILDHETHLDQFKRTEIIQCLLSDYTGTKLGIGNSKIAGKRQNTWREAKHFQTTKGSKKELSREI